MSVKWIQVVMLTVLLSPLASARAAQAEPGRLSVDLSFEEALGVERIDEPVTFGVPIPEGQLTDTKALILQDESGRAIPSDFGVAQRWLSGSVRWLHVHTLLSVPAGRKTSLRLVREPGHGKTSPQGPAALKVTQESGRVTVVNGPVKLVLSARTPDLFEAAYYSPSGRFASDDQVLGGNAGSSMEAGGRSYDVVRPGSDRIEILEQSAMRVVVLVAGQFAAREDAAAKLSLDFEARIIAYAGSPRVTVDYTVINRTSREASDKVDLEALSPAFRLPFSNPGIEIGGASATVNGRLESEASILQDNSDHYLIRVNGKALQEGPGKSVKSTATGWLDVSDGRRGVAFGIRDFWQTWPKGISAAPVREGGTAVRMGLFPRESGKSQEVFIGQARTHRITLLFHGSGDRSDELSRVMASVNRPLQVVADPEWYCRRSLVYGPIAPADADFGAFAKVAEHYEQIVGQSMNRILEQIHDGRTSREITRDSYGWMDWGDVFFRTPNPNEGLWFDDPEKNLSWSGNYYDWGFAMLMQFMRTGDMRYLETGLRAGAYTADVFIVHYHPDPTLIGACHYCPPRYQAAMDDGVPYISRENNHAKIASVLARWQWQGDWWARQVALESFNNALTLQGADIKGWEQCRGNGHRLRILWLAYHFTGERKYREKAQQLIDLGVAYAGKNPEFDPGQRPSQRFMVGIALEGLILHYWDTHDPAIVEAVKAAADRAYHENKLEHYTSNMALAFGFLWNETGDPVYLKALEQILLATKPTDQAKIFGQAFRSTPWALAYLEKAAATVARPPRP